MKRFSYNKYSALLVSALLLTACQPPDDASQSAITKVETTNKDADLSFVTSDDTVTLSADSILNLKSSRYQPSLGLQGEIEPIKQSRFLTAKAVTVQKVLVKEGQWVEEGSPLFILERQTVSKSKASADAVPSPSSNQATDEQANDRISNNKNNNIVENNQANTTSATAKEVKANNDISVSNSAPLEDTKPANTAQSSDSQPLTNQSTKQPTTEPKLETELETKAKKLTITVRASFTGRVNELPVASGDQLEAGTVLLSLADDSHLQFIAILPIQAEPQLSVGQTVNFTTQNNTKKYTGQISKLTVGDSPNKLRVYVQVLKNDASREGSLRVGMTATGRVNYGQIAVGTIVPERAIHDADITALQKPPYQPLAPLTANVWIIKQDQSLTRQPVEIIEYNPITEQYLIAGVNNDSLICLANLPVESAGKKVVIS